MPISGRAVGWSRHHDLPASASTGIPGAGAGGTSAIGPRAPGADAAWGRRPPPADPGSPTHAPHSCRTSDAATGALQTRRVRGELAWEYHAVMGAGGRLASRRAHRRVARTRWLVLAATGAFVLASCSTAATTSSQVTLVEAGQIPKADLPHLGSPGRSGSGGGPVLNTVPLAQENPTTALFTAIGVFQSCLSGMGVSFIGIPNAKAGPDAGVNNSAYIHSLVTCAAKSDIVQALKAAQSAQDNLTLAQIKTENKDYLKWRTCMIGRGWTIPPPVPNSKGLLFSFGGGGGGAPNFKPPPGQSLFSSPDLQQCAAKAEQGQS